MLITNDIFECTILERRYDPYTAVEYTIKSIKSIKPNGSSYTSYQIRKNDDLIGMFATKSAAQERFTLLTNDIPDNIVQFKQNT